MKGCAHFWGALCNFLSLRVKLDAANVITYPPYHRVFAFYVPKLNFRQL